jgi:hypothetical protein
MSCTSLLPQLPRTPTRVSQHQPHVKLPSELVTLPPPLKYLALKVGVSILQGIVVLPSGSSDDWPAQRISNSVTARLFLGLVRRSSTSSGSGWIMPCSSTGGRIGAAE